MDIEIGDDLLGELKLHFSLAVVSVAVNVSLHGRTQKLPAPSSTIVRLADKHC